MKSGILIVGVDFSNGKDLSTICVRGEHGDILNIIQGERAEKLYKELTAKE